MSFWSSFIPGADVATAYQSGKFSKKERKSAQQFSLYMDSTKYQRAMQDLNLAGLNPILALTSGGISGVGGGGASSAMAATPQPRSGGGDLAGQVRGFMKAAPERALVEASAKAAEADADAKSKGFSEPLKTQADYELAYKIGESQNRGMMYKAQEEAAKASALQSTSSARQADAMAASILQQTRSQKVEAETMELLGPILNALRKAGVSAPRLGGGSSAKSLGGGVPPAPKIGSKRYVPPSQRRKR